MTHKNEIGFRSKFLPATPEPTSEDHFLRIAEQDHYTAKLTGQAIQNTIILSGMARTGEQLDPGNTYYQDIVKEYVRKSCKRISEY